MRLVGIDPGFDRLGWSIGDLDRGVVTLVAFGCIQTNPHARLSARYTQLIDELQQLIDKFQPDEIALESLFFSNNQKTAMHVSEARGIILAQFLAAKVKCFEYTPLQIKQAVTGFGKAEKNAVEKMLRLQFKLGAEKIMDDTMDAIGVLVTHGASRLMKEPI